MTRAIQNPSSNTAASGSMQELMDRQDQLSQNFGELVAQHEALSATHGALLADHADLKRAHRQLQNRLSELEQRTEAQTSQEVAGISEFVTSFSKDVTATLAAHDALIAGLHRPTIAVKFKSVNWHPGVILKSR